MAEITVNLYELAEVICNCGFSWDLKENGMVINDHNYDEYCDKVEAFISPLTPECYFISEAGFNHLLEELQIIINKRLFEHLLNTINDYDKEDQEIEKSTLRYYEVEKDGN